MAQETIFVQTDPSFDIVLRSLNELNSQGLLQVTHIQTAWIPRIESNIEGDANKHFFGAANEGCIQSFARSASSVARMCMLQATNVHQMHWPETGNISGPRNKAILNGQGQNQLQMPNNVGNFILANNAVGARRYYSKYDHLYPHFLIEDNLIPVGTNNPVFLPSMMLIINHNFTQVVEITTTFRAERRQEQINLFHCYIHVVCIVRKIKASTDGKSDQKFTRLLRELINSVGSCTPVKVNYFEKLTKATEKKGPVEDYPDLFENLNIAEPAKEEKK